MNMMMRRPLIFDRKKLAMDALKASIKARKMAGADLISPINVYDTCERHGIIVRFNDISMEGMYDRHPKPRIHISALRPLVRRSLTCAHELGHHVFGHGSTIDELSERADVADHNDPNEFVANQFAYFFMMPTLGIRNSLASRNINLGSASAKDLFCISSNFGVGYTTLLNHLRYGLNILPDKQFRRLRQETPKSLRREVLQRDVGEPMVLMDRHWTSPTIDLESGDYLVLPSKLTSPRLMRFIDEVSDGFVYQAGRAGIERIDLPALGRGAFVRIAKRTLIANRPVGYIGLARYRHLEDDDE